MWNGRKEDELAPRGASPTVAQLGRDGIPISTMPSRAADADSSRAVSGVGKSVVIKGEIYSREDLMIDGEVEGTINLPDHRLTIGPGGKVQAGVNAREIIVRGAVNGKLDAAERIEIRKDANVTGDVAAPRVAIEDGAYLKGRVDVSREEPAKSSEQRPPKQVSATVSSLN